MDYAASARWDVIDAPEGTQLRVQLWNDARVTVVSPRDGAAFVICGEGD